MPVLMIMGAGGRAGRQVVRAALDAGLEFSVFVRDLSRFEAALRPLLTVAELSGIRVIEGDASEADTVTHALLGCETVINAAGSSADPAAFRNICRTVVRAAEVSLSGARRIWLFGGVVALNVPGRDYRLLDCPGIPARLKVHGENLAQLSSTALDWSFMCPGPMIDIKTPVSDSVPTELAVSIDELPYRETGLLARAPRMLQPLLMLRRMGMLTVSYESVARLIIAESAPQGRLSRHRVGVARKVEF